MVKSSTQPRKPRKQKHPGRAAQQRTQKVYEYMDLVKYLEAKTLIRISSNELWGHKFNLKRYIFEIERIMPLGHASWLRLNHIREELKEIENKLNKAKSSALSEQSEKSFFTRHFSSGKGVEKNTLDTIQRLEKQHQQIKIKLDEKQLEHRIGAENGFGTNIYLSVPMRLPSNQKEFLRRASSLISIIESTMENQSVIEKQKEAKAREAAKVKADRAEKQIRLEEQRSQIKKEKEELMRSQAAAYLNKIREEADSVKKRLPRDHLCPYCSGPLGPNAHADHIHPVSQGGGNTIRNMVYACRDCNLKKSDLTIKQFCNKYSRDRDTIENALELLGKRI